MVFHIVWDSRTPGPATDCVSSNYRPISAAVSNGYNLAARMNPRDRVRIGVAVAYTDAHYTETVRSGDDVIIEKGDVLGGPPQVPEPRTGGFEKAHSARPSKMAARTQRGGNPGTPTPTRTTPGEASCRSSGNSPLLTT